MFIANHISTDCQEVSLSDSVSFALAKMNELSCSQLAVVEDGIFYGLISKNYLLKEKETEAPLNNFIQHFKTVYLFDYQHIYDALQLIAKNEIPFIPILDKEHIYLGYITQHNILVALNNILGDQEAAIIVVELGLRDHALSHITRIIEAENALIYGTAIKQIPNSTKLELTIKVNYNNLSAVLSSLWRNDYIVKATFRDNSDQSDIQNRYQLLMNYLDM